MDNKLPVAYEVIGDSSLQTPEAIANALFQAGTTLSNPLANEDLPENIQNDYYFIGWYYKDKTTGNYVKYAWPSDNHTIVTDNPFYGFRNNALLESDGQTRKLYLACLPKNIDSMDDLIRMNKVYTELNPGYYGFKPGVEEYYAITYTMTQDIQVDDTFIGQWEPFNFGDTFNGNGHAIDYTAVSDSASIAPLFGTVGEFGIVKDLKVKLPATGTMKVLRLENGLDGQPSCYWGAVACQLKGRIEGCHVSGGTVTYACPSENSNCRIAAGGIAGRMVGHTNSAYGCIVNCTVGDSAEQKLVLTVTGSASSVFAGAILGAGSTAAPRPVIEYTKQVNIWTQVMSGARIAGNYGGGTCTSQTAAGSGSVVLSEASRGRVTINGGSEAAVTAASEEGPASVSPTADTILVPPAADAALPQPASQPEPSFEPKPEPDSKSDQEESDAAGDASQHET